MNGPLFARRIIWGTKTESNLAGALVNEPAIVWADEPTGNLDSTNELEIMDLLTDLNKKTSDLCYCYHSEYVGGEQIE